jgi:hypothetical protein
MAKDTRFTFDGGAGTYVGTIILGFFITVITLGICYPFALVLKQRWRAKHTYIDGQQLVFTGSAIGLFGHWIKWFLLSIITARHLPVLGGTAPSALDHREHGVRRAGRTLAASGAWGVRRGIARCQGVAERPCRARGTLVVASAPPPPPRGARSLQRWGPAHPRGASRPRTYE